jgi:hypothetical protein
MYTKYGLIAYPDNEIAFSEESGLGPDASATTTSATGGTKFQQYATKENVGAALEIGSSLASLFKKGEGSGARAPKLGAQCRQSCKSAGGWLSRARRVCKQNCKAQGGVSSSKEAPAPAPEKSNAGLYIGIGAIVLILVVVVIVLVMRKKAEAK